MHNRFAVVVLISMRDVTKIVQSDAYNGFPEKFRRARFSPRKIYSLLPDLWKQIFRNLSSFAVVNAYLRENQFFARRSAGNLKRSRLRDRKLTNDNFRIRHYFCTGRIKITVRSIETRFWNKAEFLIHLYTNVYSRKEFKNILY